MAGMNDLLLKTVNTASLSSLSRSLACPSGREPYGYSSLARRVEHKPVAVPGVPNAGKFTQSLPKCHF